MFGGCKPSPYGARGIAVATSSSEARGHRLARFSLALHRSSYSLTLPNWRGESSRSARQCLAPPVSHGAADLVGRKALLQETLP
jgi:hypothetical protein